MLSTWALLLAGDLNLHGEAVLHEAWLITAGGLVQTGVAIAAWPLRPFAAERARRRGRLPRACRLRTSADHSRRFRAPPPRSRRQRRPSGRTLRGPGNAARCGRWSNKVNGSGWNWQRWPDRMLPGVDATLRAAANTLDDLAARRDVGVIAPGSQTHRTRDRRACRAPPCSATRRMDHSRERREPRRRAGRGATAAPGPRDCAASSRCAPARFVTQRGCRLH